MALAEADARALGDEGPWLEVRADGDLCAATYEPPRPVGGDGVELRASFACGHSPRELDVAAPFVDALPGRHAHLARIAGADHLLRSGAEHATVVLGGAPPPPGASFASALALGAGHVARGADHLLFLAALALGERRLARLGAVVTAFTAAHAATLALVATTAIAVPARIVEPAIAATIALVAAENALDRARVPRLLTAFAFGLVHGLGFASALRALALGGRLVGPLVGFNLGVELAQLGFVLTLALALAALRRRGWLLPRGERLACLALALVGGVALVTQI